MDVNKRPSPDNVPTNKQAAARAPRMADLCGGHPADVLIAVLPGNVDAHRARGGEVAVLLGWMGWWEARGLSRLS